MNRILISVGPINIYWYSITMLIAISTGLLLAIKESKKMNMEEYIKDLAFYIIVFGIIGARIYYVVFNFSLYKDNILDIFKIWEGGIAVYGSIIGGLLAIIWIAKKKRQSIINTTDIIAPGLLLAQSIGRWGNFFNQEAHGNVVTYEFLKNLHLPNFIINGMNINGIYYEPTFLYESIWCLIGFIILLTIRKQTKRKKGITTYSYFIWYGLGRFYIEGLRTDSLYLGTIRISQLVSIILIVIGIIGIIISIKQKRKKEQKNG